MEVCVDQAPVDCAIGLSYDVFMAHHAGMDSLAVTYGAHDVSTIEKSEPTEIVESVAQMQDWIFKRLA